MLQRERNFSAGAMKPTTKNSFEVLGKEIEGGMDTSHDSPPYDMPKLKLVN